MRNSRVIIVVAQGEEDRKYPRSKARELGEWGGKVDSGSRLQAWRGFYLPL